MTDSRTIKNIKDFFLSKDITALVYRDVKNRGKFILKNSCFEEWTDKRFNELVEEHFSSITEKIEDNIYRLDV